VAEGGLAGGQASGLDPEGRAGDVVQQDLVTEDQRGGIAAVLAADPEV
jgi:hypothetical protein